MRRYLVSAISLLTSLHAGKKDYDLNSAFSVWGEYVHMRRSETNTQQLIIDMTSKTSDTCGNCNPDKLCRTRQVVKKFDFEPGFRVGAEYVTHRTRWELTYLWIHEWHGDCSASKQGALFFSERNPYYLNNFSDADHGQVDYTSQFQNAELNFFRYATPPRQDYFSGCWLIGLRYVHLLEKFDIAFTKSGSRSSYDVATKNRLAGLQIGGGIQWNPTTKLCWDFTAKGAGFYDWASQRTFLGDYNNSVVIRDYEVDKQAYPFLVDGAISLTYQPVEYFNLHAGYQLIYLHGVALASDQLVKHDSGQKPVRTIGEALIYGFYVGLTISL